MVNTLGNTLDDMVDDTGVIVDTTGDTAEDIMGDIVEDIMGDPAEDIAGENDILRTGEVTV